MASVADGLRDDTRARVLAMPVAERIALCLALGDEDVERYSQYAGLPSDVARRQLQRRHAEGRHPSRSAALGEPDDTAQ